MVSSLPLNNYRVLFQFKLKNEWNQIRCSLFKRVKLIRFLFEFYQIKNKFVFAICIECVYFFYHRWMSCTFQFRIILVSSFVKLCLSDKYLIEASSIHRYSWIERKVFNMNFACNHIQPCVHIKAKTTRE